ncbi:MAG: AAA family ATPase, partial [Anaerolineae bacterium]
SPFFDLTIKIGVGYGRCLEVVVGDPAQNLEFVLAGTAVDEAVAAQQKAESGQVVAGRTILEKAALPVSGPFRVVEEVPPVPSAQPLIYWESMDQSALSELLTLSPLFIPPALFERLQNPNTQFVAENRSVTSLFVGFEGIDFEHPDAGEQLQSYYQWACAVVARYGGANSRVNRVLTGDKGSQLHIIFGAPVAPDAPIQAILCALALQTERPSFISKQQIGVVAGRVFACAVGSQNRREYTIVGSAVNLSSRLTTRCPDGEVYTDAVTAVRVQERIALDKLPPVQLKGKSEPVTIYRAMGEKKEKSAVKARFTRVLRPPFGREEELKQLQKRHDEALAGEGGIVALYGPFGSGQMPLLAVAVHQWLDAGGIVYTGVCQLHLTDVPFAPWQAVWRDIFGLTADMDPETQAETVKKRALALCPDCEDVSLWGDLFGLPLVAATSDAPSSVEIRQSALFGLLRRSLVAVAAVRPLLIILEDIHWADQLSLDLIDALAQAIADLPAMLLLTYRTANDFRFRTLNRENCLAIPLFDWPRDRARKLVKKRLGTDELPMLVEQRLGMRDRQGRGSPVNPLFLEESLKMMLANGVLRMQRDADGSCRVRIQETGLLNMQVPDTIYNVLLARLDQLPAAIDPHVVVGVRL